MILIICKGFTNQRKGIKNALMINMIDSYSTTPYSYRSMLWKVMPSTNRVITAVVKNRVIVYLTEK